MNNRMHWNPRLTIRTKLLTSFLLILSLLCILSYQSIQKMNKMGEQSTQVAEYWVPILGIFGKLNGEVSEVERLLLRVILEAKPSEIERLTVKLNAGIQTAETTLNTYKPLVSADQQTEYDQLHKDWTSFSTKIPAVLQAYQANDSTKGLTLFEAMHVDFLKIKATIVTIIDRDQLGSNQASQTSVKLYNSGINIILTLSIVSIILALVIALFVSNRISKPIRIVNRQLHNIAQGEGDLTKELEINSNDEIAELVMAFNALNRKLRMIMGLVQSNAKKAEAAATELMEISEQTAKSSEIIAIKVDELANGAEIQARGSQDSTIAMQEMTIAIQRLAEISALTSEKSNASTSEVELGSEHINTAIQQMNTIHEVVTEISTIIQKLFTHSGHIEQIVGVISAIASQTNLLALNASIEAARAGIHGRGFAVVAGEVKKLAELSEQSTSEINQLIKNIQGDTLSAVKIMEIGNHEVLTGMTIISKAGDAFQQIRNQIYLVSEQLEEASAVSEEMAAGSQQITASVEESSRIANHSLDRTQQVAAITEKQLAAMQEISASSVALNQIALELSIEAGRFRV
jgi:methyl-accepting chemotaxis protein